MAAKHMFWALPKGAPQRKKKIPPPPRDTHTPHTAERHASKTEVPTGNPVPPLMVHPPPPHTHTLWCACGLPPYSTHVPLFVLPSVQRKSARTIIRAHEYVWWSV